MNKKNKIFSFLFAFLFALIAVPSHYKAYPVILLFIILLLHKPKQFDKTLFFKNSLLYWGLLLSFFYSKNQLYGQTFIFETQVLLLILPVIFALIPRSLKQNIYKNQYLYFTVYIITVFLFTISPLRWLFKPYSYDLQKLLFHYSGIINSPDYGIFRVHPVYMAIAIGWGILLSLFLIIKINQQKYRLLLIILNLYFLIILLHMARMGAIFGLYPGVLILIYFYKKNFLFPTIAILILGIFTILIVPSTQKRIEEVYNIKNQEILKYSSTGKHLRIFQVSINTFKKSPIFGYGLGSHKDQLMKEYKLEGETDLLKNHYSTHNQYMSFLLIGGLILLLLYFTMIFFSVDIAWKTKNYLMFSFLIYFSIAMFFENYLEREAGIVVFSVFFNYLNWLSFYKLENKFIIH